MSEWQDLANVTPDEAAAVFAEQFGADPRDPNAFNWTDEPSAQNARNVIDYRSALKELAGNTICAADFIKKDGSARRMVFRLGVIPPTVPDFEKRARRMAEFGYITVFDMQKREYRTLNPRTVTRLKVRGMTLQQAG